MTFYIVEVNNEKYPLPNRPFVYGSHSSATKCAEHFSQVGNKVEIIETQFKKKQLSHHYKDTFVLR